MSLTPNTINQIISDVHIDDPEVLLQDTWLVEMLYECLVN